MGKHRLDRDIFAELHSESGNVSKPSVLTRFVRVAEAILGGHGPPHFYQAQAWDLANSPLY
ncbi:hypothetical protein EG327_007266 [Venturia inaequalis]|uniref:Uncharacterized protein n=1 Tax=Venturia inaequalis TaxID=5025 RepID=A0A8H3Z3V8_VENIN|nr:hypothetical protein EG327_007266 [Venturia inaequalis]